MDMKEKSATSAGRQEWWVRPGGRSPMAVAERQAGRIQLAMAAQKAAAQRGWWVRPGSRSLRAVAERQAGQRHLEMAAQKAVMAVRPVLTPFVGAIPVVRAAKAIRLEAKAAIVLTALTTSQPLGRGDMEMTAGASWAGTAKTVAEIPYRIEERGGARPPLSVPAVAPPRFAVFFFFWDAVW
jgi:hypothetical protein